MQKYDHRTEQKKCCGGNMLYHGTPKWEKKYYGTVIVHVHKDMVLQ